MLSVAVVSTWFVVWILRSLMMYGGREWLGRSLLFASVQSILSSCPFCAFCGGASILRLAL